MSLGLCILLLTPAALGLPVATEQRCGYESCPTPVPGKLNVHIVAHTHDDVGWLKTVDQYYYGSHTDIQKAGVQYILDSVITELLHDPNRRFIYVETAYLWKWWQEQSAERQDQVRHLVDTGRLEIIGGAWSMNDEAAAHYHSIVDQFAWGLRKLNDTFGRCARPRIGWQIDPFGHSREMASLLSQMGYDGLFLGRIDYQDKSHRLGTKTMEQIWQASDSLGDSAELFTHALYNTYSPPPGFCFDVLCSDEPIIDDKRSPDYNVDTRVKDFLTYVRTQASHYKSDNIVLTMGGDFTYQDAAMWYMNLDKLIKYVNEKDSSINIFYSTPGCYLKAVNDAGLTWSTKQDDFFPYASDPHAYWTGYFTSRPTSKYFERQGNNFLQVCKQLAALADLSDGDNQKIDVLREAMGVMQHHDAITGTEKQHVFSDYGRILSEGFAACQEVVNKAVKQLAFPTEELEFTSCLLHNVSQCEVTENAANFVVTVYNPLSHPVNHYVRLPVSGSHYSVRDPQGTEVAVQLVPVPAQVLSLPERTSKSTNEIVFQANNIPSLGFHTYYVSQLEKAGPAQSVSRKSDALQIANEAMTVSVDGKTGRLLTHFGDGQKAYVEQSFAYYEGCIGNNEVFENRSSGAYIFRPNGSRAMEFPGVVNSTVYEGDIVSEIHQTFSNWVSQVVRLYKDENHLELEWLVGPIPVQDGIGKEVISRFTTNLTTDSVFYTDSNGREMLKRRRDFRPTWNLEMNESIAGNYYPVTSKILIRDEDAQLQVAVLNDRAQGGSSLQDGQLELMVHRRLLHDDAFGVGEALNETAYQQGLIARGHHYLIGGPTNGSGNKSLSAMERELAQRKLLSPWTLVARAEGSFEQFSALHRTEFHGLQEPLPSDIQILTLEPWKKGTILVRLENILEKGEDEQQSKPVTVSLQKLFSDIPILDVQETTLDGSQLLQDTQRLQWKLENGEKTPRTNHRQGNDPFIVPLAPMQIRTFVIRIANLANDSKHTEGGHSHWTVLLH